MARKDATNEGTSSRSQDQASNPVPKRGKSKTVPFYKLFSFADSTDVLLMVIGAVGAISNGMSTPLMSTLLGDVVNSFGKNQNNKDIVHVVSKVSLKFVYLAFGSAVASFLQVACWMVTGERQAARIRSLYLKTILRQDIAFFDEETSTGEVIGRMSGDTVLIQNAMGEKVGKFLQLMATFIGGFTIAYLRGWFLALVMTSAVPLLVVVGALLSLFITRMAARRQIAYAEASTLVEQTIGSIRIVASFTGEKRAINLYNKFINKAYKLSVRQGIFTGFGAGCVMLVSLSTLSLAVWFGGKMILEKGYSGGQVLNVILVMLGGSSSLGQTSPCLSVFASGQAAAYKMFEAIKRKPNIDAYSSSGKILDEISGDIELRDIYFSYPARPDEQIFRGFSLSIPSGTTAAMVGQSGSGKSTVISLIERFYDPLAGEVLIDGINLKDFQLKWIREKIGLVSQEPALFASSIRDNIAYGKDGATNEEIRNAAALANAVKFIDKLPQGFDTMVGEHGTQLSGGQKQRIAIARAILKDPRILLLDEATSALDAESERVVQDALDRIMVNRTTVVVAHRLTTVRNADMIAVIHRGKIVEKGSHSVLLEDPDGAYSQLVQMQEMNKESAHQVADDDTKSEITLSSLSRKSRQRGSLQGSIKRGSSIGSGSSHSLSLALCLSTGLSMREQDLSVSDDMPTEKAPKVQMRRLAYLNKPELPVLLAGATAASILGAIVPIYGLVLSKAIQVFFESPHELRKGTEFWSVMFLLLGVVYFLIYPIKTYLFAVAGSKLIERIRSMCFEKVVNMEVGWFDDPENSSGVLGARLSADAASVQTLVGDQLSTLVEIISTVTTAMIISFTASWKLSLITLALIPLVGVNGFSQVKFMKGFSADAKTKYEEASQVATDAVGSIRTVASFCAEDKIMQLFQKKCDGPLKNGVRLGLISGTGLGLSFFMLCCFYAITFYVGALLVRDGQITFSDVFRVFYALTTASSTITRTSSLTSDTSRAKNAAASVFRMLDRRSKIDPSDDSGTTLFNVNGDIGFRHVSFKYPLRPNVKIFRDINLSIHSGQTVALVGESGSGKSTVIALLQRFYDPDSGRITLDGTDIQQLQLKWLRQQMGLVSQEPALFNDTIRANIEFGKGGAVTEAEIIAASEMANAHSFISGFHQGYDTVVGERGVQLSGGQKQRIAIARAIVKSPKILLLDEATSALDAESERVVQAALEKVMVNRTSVVVAHRLSTIRNADLIAVVKNGVIAEKGTHERLINVRNGVYASLVALHASAN